MDLTPRMLEWGRERSAAEGLAIEWVEADAEDLPFEDGRFDVVASSFGAMFAPRPQGVAAELFRVVRCGGVVGLENWIPAGIPGAPDRAVLRVCAGAAWAWGAGLPAAVG